MCQTPVTYMENKECVLPITFYLQNFLPELAEHLTETTILLTIEVNTTSFYFLSIILRHHEK